MTSSTARLALVVGVTFVATSAPAQEPDPAPVKARVQEFAKALAGQDAATVAAFWTPLGEYTHGAVTIRGRDNIRKAYTEHMKKKPAGKVTTADETVRFLSDSVAVCETTFVIDRDNPADSVRSKASALFVKADGQWSLGLLRETSEGPALAELAWLVGEWEFKNEKATGTITVRFSEKKTFLLVQTRVKDGDDEEIATQIIGIDPASSKLKSWTFESDGSIGTADWVRTETGWVASVSATSADGDPVKAVTTIKPAGRNEFTFQMTERTVDGEKVPDTAPVKVTRATKTP